MRSQRGIALIITIPIILLGMLLAVGVLSFLNYSNKRSTIQSAVDISLINAAQEVCSSKGCWERSRVAFLESLQANLQKMDFSFVNLSETDVDGFPVTSWENEESRLSIERVRWKLDNTYESLEKTWQQDHPGVPVHLVQYGLKVSFETKLKSLAERIIPLELTVKSQGAVAAGPLRAPCVAPFAIKACALLKEDGDLAEATMCDADRRFGPSNGYCRDGEQCLNTSEFDYDPMSENPFSGLPSYPKSQFPGLLVKYSPPEDEACFFATPRYGTFHSSTKDQNIIGIPGSSVIPSETLIKSILSDSGGCVPSGIGQPFQILHEGLQDEDTAKVLWGQISNENVGGVSDGIHRPLSELTDRDEITINSNILYSRFPPPIPAPDNTVSACENIINNFNYKTFGAFSSFRSGFGFWDEYNNRSTATTCPWQDSKFNSPFWQAIVPVIADTGPEAQSCGGMNGSIEDPLIQKNTQYEIVGFAKVHIYDVGHDSASKPTNLTDYAKECSKIRVTRDSTSLHFEFQNQKNERVKGVQVRGRIACGSKTFGGASAALGEAVPVLID